jgi:hypothetical protein
MPLQVHQQSLEDALATMTEDAYVFWSPLAPAAMANPMRGFSNHFIPNIPRYPSHPDHKPSAQAALSKKPSIPSRDVWMITAFAYQENVEVAVIGRITLRWQWPEHLYWDKASSCQLGCSTVICYSRRNDIGLLIAGNWAANR